MPYNSALYNSALFVLLLILGLPLVAGLGQTLWGGLNPEDLWAAWRGRQLALTLFVGITATVLALLAALGMAACFQGRVRLLTAVCLPLLAVPHAAVAQALGLLLAPAGFLMRLLSPWATGFEAVPALWLYDQHPQGWTLILALAIKELAFFLILIFTQSASLPIGTLTKTARALGYAPAAAWWHGALPNLLPRLVLPIFVVLAFSLSVVDLAVLVGPSRVKTFAHALHQDWSKGASRGQVLAGACWLLGLTLVCLAFAGAFLGMTLRWLRRAQAWPRRWAAGGLPQIGAGLGLGLFTTAGLCLALLPLQSFIETTGRRARFPDLWTGQFATDAWGEAAALALPTLPLTLALGLCTTLFCLATTLWLLQGEAGLRGRRSLIDTAVLLPLLLPQFALLSGGAFLGLKIGLIPEYGFWAAVWLHSLFVFPYTYLVLAPAFRGLDPLLSRAAASLGKGPTAQFWQVKLPLLHRPMAFAVAWGLAVSLALYLPTYFASGGRFETLLTLGITQLTGRGDSLRAVWGLLLLILPLCFFLLAAALSAWQARNRRGLRP